MEQVGVLSRTIDIDLFALHYVSTPRINNALAQFIETFNNHGLSTEHSLPPNQLWISGILQHHSSNYSGVRGIVDDSLPDDLAMYGDDPDAPQPQGIHLCDKARSILNSHSCKKSARQFDHAISAEGYKYFRIFYFQATQLTMEYNKDIEAFISQTLLEVERDLSLPNNSLVDDMPTLYPAFLKERSVCWFRGIKTSWRECLTDVYNIPAS